MHLDHVDPLGGEGPDELENLVAACIACNHEKSDKKFPELLRAFDGKLPGAIVASQIADARERGEGLTLAFHEPFNWRRWMLKEYPGRFERDVDKFWDDPSIGQFIAAMPSEELRVLFNSSALWCSIWEIQSGRPYFNVYPVVASALLRTRIDIPAEAIARSTWGISICFAQGYELMPQSLRIRSILAATIAENNRKSAGITVEYIDKQGVACHISGAVLDDQQVGHMLPESAHDPLSDETYDIRDAFSACWSLAIGTRLLADDPDFCEPILLAKDHNRDLTPEQREKAIQRAIKRTGKRGFTIGRDWVASPHIRRPHFAIRWTGKGRSVPRLVPVKGSIVRRSELLKIPTGYKTYDDEPK